MYFHYLLCSQNEILHKGWLPEMPLVKCGKGIDAHVTLTGPQVADCHTMLDLTNSPELIPVEGNPVSLNWEFCDAPVELPDEGVLQFSEDCILYFSFSESTESPDFEKLAESLETPGGRTSTQHDNGSDLETVLEAAFGQKGLEMLGIVKDNHHYEMMTQLVNHLQLVGELPEGLRNILGSFRERWGFLPLSEKRKTIRTLVIALREMRFLQRQMHEVMLSSKEFQDVDYWMSVFENTTPEEALDKSLRAMDAHFSNKLQLERMATLQEMLGKHEKDVSKACEAMYRELMKRVFISHIEAILFMYRLAKTDMEKVRRSIQELIKAWTVSDLSVVGFQPK